jgi:hypothetical protein
MAFSSDRHRGQSVETLVLDDPAYVRTLLGELEAGGPLAGVVARARRLIAVFDARPLVVPCQGPGCTERATRGCVYQGAVRPTWWCARCDPYEQGAAPGKLVDIASAGEAIDYVRGYCNGRAADLRFLIRALARARGLPARAGPAAKACFGAARPGRGRRARPSPRKPRSLA